MYFITQKIKGKLSANKKLTAISYKLKAVLSVFKNLQPTTYNLKPSVPLQPSRGFTLIETLVAISILMVAVASPLTIAQKGVASAIYAKDQIIASYLAQDAIEYIINLTDQNRLNGVDWLTEITGPNYCDTKCAVDTSNNSIAFCNNGECEMLNYNDSEHIYTLVGGQPSRFTRSVTVIEVNAGIEALITVLMSWENKGKPRELTFKTRIFNWKQ